MEKVILIEWTEYERGWGQRPDGISLYADSSFAQKHIDSVYSSRHGAVPDEYSNPTNSYFAYINDQELLNRIKSDFNDRGVCWLSNREVNDYSQNDRLIVSKDRPFVRY